MQLVYKTNDEVQLADGMNWADRCGIELITERQNGQSDGLLIDLDSMLPDEREASLRQLMTRPESPTVAAVHSYSLTDEQTEDLESNGVKVFRRLEPEVFSRIAQAADEARESGEPAVIPIRSRRAATKACVRVGG